VVVPMLFIVAAGEGTYRVFWTLFGTSNQLLAALTLLAIAVWLRADGRRYRYVFVPMAFVMAVTITALVIQARVGLAAFGVNAATMNGIVAVVLIALAGILGVEATGVFRSGGRIRDGVAAGSDPVA
jgi:carbon starvation protein